MAGNADAAAAALPPELAEKLDRIAALMALTLVRRMEKAEKIRVLDAVGYSPAEIGAFLGERPNTISAALYRQKRQGRARKRAPSHRVKS